MKTKNARRNRKPSTVRLTTSVLTQVACLYPQQDPIRLTAGFLAFGLPLKSTMFVLKRLAPRFKNEDLIRLAAGFNDLRTKLKAERLATVARVMTAP